jgi:hypothetical protein
VTANEPAPVQDPPSDDYPDAVRMALASIAAVGVGFFLCYLPYGRLATILLSLLSAALAGLSLLGLDRRAWIGWIGVALNGLFVLVLVGFPGQLGLEGWWPVRTPPAPEQTAGLTPDGWVDAGAAAWEENDVLVGLTFAMVGPPPGPAGSERLGPCLWIGVRVTAVGSREFSFSGWDPTASNGPILTTASGTRLAGRPAGKAELVTVKEGKPAEFILAFEVPPDGQALRLELPAAAYGGTAPARFQIAPELIARK